MKTFKRYLLNKGFAGITVIQHERNIEPFLQWLINNSIDIRHCRYSEIIRFIDQSVIYRNIKTQFRNRINRILTSITYYYEFLSERNPLILNPAKTIRVRNNHVRARQIPISYDELVSLYNRRSANTPRDIRNQVILGFLIFQGMTVSELNSLKVDDIRLREGLVLIKEPDSKSLKKGTTARLLPLDAVQVIDILEYLKNIRPKILSGRFLESPGKKPSKGKRLRRTNRMILSLNGSPFIKNTLHHLFIDIKKLFPKIISASQIRHSIITHWLSKFDLRKVQYMAGHRFVSSTEWYKPGNLEELKREINLYHPLK